MKFARNRVAAVAIGSGLLIAIGGIGGAFAAGEIGSDMIADNSIGSWDVKDQTLKSRDIREGGVASSEVRDGSLGLNDFSADAKAGLKGDKGDKGDQGDPGTDGVSVESFSFDHDDDETTPNLVCDDDNNGEGTTAGDGVFECAAPPPAS